MIFFVETNPRREVNVLLVCVGVRINRVYFLWFPLDGVQEGGPDLHQLQHQDHVFMAKKLHGGSRL